MTDQPPAAPDSPGPDLSGALADAARQREQEALAQSEAIANMALLLDGLQQEVVALQEENMEHEYQIKQLASAFIGLSCPNRKGDPNVKDENAISTIGVCMSCGTCDCDAGHQLSMGIKNYGGDTTRTQTPL